ncbi:uncharacterized protein LOC121375807 isoform X2 [Gigantopelta aegis]|uniref:uncharacterized protein LOC121375807 isoform X2 n=1 Tax=Gigantopelta aegis TaxID=1735272 RepID=UPI001B8877EB|nr:uncharacterized protein LOC121375807 isoform X2 [Gigantopelta aegis]
MAVYVDRYRGGEFSTSLNLGSGERTSAKMRAKESLRRDLELQMRERSAAKKRERLQDMSVNASGWLDPEKGPERLKPLGGVDWTVRKTGRESRVQPYHTLFLYDEQKRAQGIPRERYIEPEITGIVTDRPRLDLGKLDPPPDIVYRSNTLGPAPTYRAPPVYDYGGYQAPPIMNTGPSVPLVAPLQPIPQYQHQPVVIQAPSVEPYVPRYMPFQTEIITSRVNLVDNDKLRLRMERENDDYRRRLQKEMDDGQKRLRDQELEAQRRLELMRIESEARRRELERQRYEWERLWRLRNRERPRSIPIIVQPQNDRNKLLDEMDLYRRRLRDERRLIEELLMNRKPIQKENLDIRVIKKEKKQAQPIPVTPPTPDNANPENVHVFTSLKHKDHESRREFRSIFPDVPYTNKKLEWQQGALLKLQEQALEELRNAKTDKERDIIYKKYFFTQPVWLDREITPFGRKYVRSRVYTTGSLDCENPRGRMRGLSTDPDSVLDNYKLHLRSHRASSADTLTDETWLRPSSADI